MSLWWKSKNDWLKNCFLCRRWPWADSSAISLTVVTAVSSRERSNQMTDKDFVLACSKTARSFRYRIMFACPVQWAITATRLSSTSSSRKANRNACSNWSRMSYTKRLKKISGTQYIAILKRIFQRLYEYILQKKKFLQHEENPTGYYWLWSIEKGAFGKTVLNQQHPSFQTCPV